MSDKMIFMRINTRKLLTDFRNSKKYSLRELSNLVNYSYQTISKYETGVLSIDEEILKIISGPLEFDYELIIYMESQLLNDIKALQIAIIYDDIEDNYPLIIKVKDCIKYADYYSNKNQLYMLLFCLDILKVEKTMEAVDYVNNHMCYLDGDLIKQYHHYKAIEFLMLDELEPSIQHIQEALILENNSDFSGLIYYHAALIFTYYGKLFLAYNYSKQAEDSFVRFKNFNRLYNVQANIATIKAKLNNIEDAKSMDRKLLLSKPNDNLEFVLLNNLAWFELLDGNYMKCSNILDEIEVKRELSNNGKFMKLWSLFGLEKFELACEFYTQNINLIDDQMFQLEMDVLYMQYTNRTNEDYEEKLLELYNLTKTSRNFENHQFVLDKLINYYESKRKYMVANFYYSKKVDLLNWFYSLK